MEIFLLKFVNTGSAFDNKLVLFGKIRDLWRMSCKSTIYRVKILGIRNALFLYLQPEEPRSKIAALVLYLCSDEASFVTGSNYTIDGGLVTLNT